MYNRLARIFHSDGAVRQDVGYGAPISPTRTMPHRIVLLLLICLPGIACRQPDGILPQPQGEQVNKTSDISRDLLGVAAARPAAMEELRADVGNLSPTAPPDHLVRELTTRLGEALAGTTLSDETAARLAEKLYVATTADRLSERQQEMLRREFTSTLTSVGVPQAKAEPVAQVVGQIQSAIGQNRKRWWHLR